MFTSGIEKEPARSGSELFPTDGQIPACLWDGLNYVQSNGAHIQCYLRIPMEPATYLRDSARYRSRGRILQTSHTKDVSKMNMLPRGIFFISLVEKVVIPPDRRVKMEVPNDVLNN